MRRINRTIYYASFPLSFISLIFPIYAAALGARGIEIGLLYSIFSLISITMRPIVGGLIDRKGRKLGIIIGLALYFMSNIAFFIATTYQWLLLGRIIQSFGASFLWISIDVYIADISKEDNRSRNYGIREQISSKGAFVGSFIGLSILLNEIGNDPFKVAFIIFSLISILALYLSFRDIKEANFKKNLNTGNKLRKDKNYKLFLLIIFVFSFISNLTTPIFLLYLQDYITKDLGLITLIFIPTSILSMYLPKKFGILADNSSREKILFIGIGLYAFLQLLIPFTNSYNAFIILYTIISLTVIFYSPAFSSLIIDYVGQDKRGRSYGLYSLASGLGASFGPIIGALIYEKVNNYLVFYIKGILLIVLISILCYIYYRSTSNKNRLVIK